MQLKKATSLERQRLIVLQAKFEREDLRSEVGLDKILCKYAGYKVLLRDHTTENWVQGTH